jgi:hypothetical protein
VSELPILKISKDEHIASLKSVIRTILDAVDYTSDACRPNEMVGAVLPREIIELARAISR